MQLNVIWATSVQVVIQFRVQFGINLHEGVFQKAETARAALASANYLHFLKNSQDSAN